MSASYPEGAVAIVTGAGGGIGAQCARRLAADGLAVVVADINGQAAASVAAQIQEANGTACSVQVDVGNPLDCSQMMEAVQSIGTHLAVAVNNAGVRGQRKPIAEMDFDQWRNAMAVNLDGVFLCMQSEIRSMQATGGGAIVNMASILGTVAYPGVPAYVASKHAVIGLTRSAALDYAASGIRVNAVCPGFVQTALTEGVDPAVTLARIADTPRGQLGTVSEVADLVSFLCSPQASNITGAAIVADGGFTTH
jgi:NAD(P)-dependent dehydrogenase (short-subunit alcohol dehydrogenase family)